MRSDGQWAMPQTEVDKINDKIAWRNLGTAWSKRERFITVDDLRRCAQINKHGARCELWATHQKEGVRYCRHCKPEGAEQL